MSDLAKYRLGFNPTEQLNQVERPPQDWVRFDQVIRTVAAIEMKPEQTNLDKLLDGRVLRIPEYQRSYSWTEENWEPLWNDIIAIAQAQVGGRKGQDIFFGILFVAESDQPGIDYDIIDGQQRLTTIGLLIRALQSRMLLVDEDSIQEDSCKQYRVAFLRKAEDYLFKQVPDFGLPKPRLSLDDINEREYLLVVSSDNHRAQILNQFERAHGNARRNAMKTTRLCSLLEISDDSPPDVPSTVKIPETSKLLLEGYSYFLQRIDEELSGLSADQHVRLLANLLDYIMHCLSVTVFRISRDHPGLLMDVFEVLNNRGLVLALTDVVNARIVQRFSASDSADGTQRILQWRKTMETFGRHFESLRDFLVDYLTNKKPGLGSRTFHADRLLEAFSHQRPTGDTRSHEPLLHDISTAEKTLAELEDAAPLYAYLIDANRETRDFGEERSNELIKDGLRRLQTLQTRQWRAFVLKCALAVESSPTVAKAKWLAEVVDTVERLALRQSICSVNPNKLEEVYRRAIIRIRDGKFDSDTTKRLSADFLEEYGELVQAEGFMSALIHKEDWGNTLSKVLLWRTYAAQHADDTMVLRKLNTTEIHLEHVMPQAPYYPDAEHQPWLRGMFSAEDQYCAVTDLLTEDDGRRNAFLSDVVALLVRDVGNTLLLKDGTNKSVSNRTLAWKLAAYRSTPGFADIEVNAPFSNWELQEDQHELLSLVELQLGLKEGRIGAEEVREGFTSEGQAIKELGAEIDKHPAKRTVDESWTAQKLAERRTAIFRNAIGHLQLPGESLYEAFKEDEAKSIVSTRIDTLLARIDPG